MNGSQMPEPLTYYREQCEKCADECDRLTAELNAIRARVANLEAAIKDADYVLAGSRAIEGQPDGILEMRENALMRFFEVVGTIATAGRAKERGE